MKDLWKKYGRVWAVLLAAAVLFAVGRALAAPEQELPSEAGAADAAGGGHLRAV